MSGERDTHNDLWAFREGKKDVRTEFSFRELIDAVDRLAANVENTTTGMSALMRAGEFESGLADKNFPALATAQKVTDDLARLFVGDRSAIHSVWRTLQELSRHNLPPTMSISPAEGFAYYALHPAEFAAMAENLARDQRPAMVLGIRSIGTTLSAIVRAAVEQQGKRAERITVRPTGHPYDRVTSLSKEQLRLIKEWNGANFLVIDEGPGRSGSSFLSVAEALVAAGVPDESIRMMGSRQPDVNSLCTTNAAERWSRFQFFWPERVAYKRFWDHLYIGGGEWRRIMVGEELSWPESWTQMERLKFLTPDGKHIFKFEGYGRFGEEILERAQAIAEAGFGPTAEDGGDGMIRYPVIAGQPLSRTDLSRELLEQVADYCAYRARAFRVENTTQLPAMMQFNIMQEFGVQLDRDFDELCTINSIVADGRMQPHEWVKTENGSFIKVDGYSHGDDHFFPGPTDIAWDLAGMIVEWNLDQGATDFLVRRFRQQSGMEVSARLPSFVLAYSVFRMAYCKMALPTVEGSAEWGRMERAYNYYRALAQQQITQRFAIRPTPGNLSAEAQPGTAA